MYQGWLTFAGTEIINAERTEMYARNAGLGWFLGCDSCEDLHLGLGDDAYTSPPVDECDWFDEDDPATWRFYGLYPLSISGIEDSTRTAQAVEALGDGGIVTVPRTATRTIVVSGMLIGGDDIACDAGMNWLRGALAGSPCSVAAAGCTGDTVCFMLGCPEICGDTDVDADACLDPYMVNMQQVTTIEGPKVNAKHLMSDGGAVWEVEFTMVAAKPWICSQPIATMHGGSSTGDPNKFKPIYNLPTVSCIDPDVPDFRDPTCEALPKPPAYPVIPLNCFTLPTTWDRYSLPIPAASVPRWSEAIPVVRIQAPGGETPMRMVRVRFYDDPLNRFDPSALSECGFCSEFLVTYIPAGYTIEIDGMTETILMEVGTTVYNAAQSVTSTDNSGFSWPYMTCGSGYVMTIDVPHGAPAPLNVDVTVYHRSA